MVQKLSMSEARRKFKDILDAAEAGEDVIITRHGEDAVRLTRAGQPTNLKAWMESLERFRSNINLRGEPVSETVVKMRETDRY